ncbi:MAG TPA: S-adenosylmethionine:tRNA ribosyltransferase-isomerase [Jatrophihabitans sp.]|jgi:S-adenosylmethionine:tRNA ribosyltransferase-isomerase|nr:S-adenosylmethionine:tRNA ribosyltransferase-isomerase [Jatrophihabitans sp.]
MTMHAYAPSTRFELPENLTATEPPEHRGLSRDGVRLLVAESVPGPDGRGSDGRGSDEPGSDGSSGVRLVHSRFRELGSHLRPGDLIVVNTSKTIAAEIDGVLDGNWPVVLHVASPLTDRSWVLELRTAPDAAQPLLGAQPGEAIRLAKGMRVRLLAPYPEHPASPTGHGNRLWRAEVTGDRPFPEYLLRHGRPISYGYLRGRWPLADYQTVFARHPGSAEMPSAGRPFTAELVTDLISRGIAFAPITLHTGVSSQEAGEPPQPERYEVPAATARLVNATRLNGGRVIAVGTTVTRALESAAGPDGWLSPARGWTELVIGPDHPARAVTGLITGLHNPDASHLLLVESVAGARLAQRAYDAAVEARYLWHEFGDSCLLLGNTR